MRAWAWAGQYLITMVLALLLGFILGNLPLFREAGIGTTGLTAAHMIQFLAYAGALVQLWLLGHAARTRIPEERKDLWFTRQLAEPLATLIVVITGHQVLLLLLAPFLGGTGRSVYNWLFVLGSVGAALWLVLAGSSAWAMLTGERPVLQRPWPTPSSETPPVCPQCGTPVRTNMKFCGQCGQSLAPPRCRQCGRPLVPGEKFCAECGQSTG
jgi:hypothetical protein